jgi:hypothetical protein
MRLRSVLILLILSLLAAPLCAETLEAGSADHAALFRQEFDIIFWQTLPFAALWGCLLERQVSLSLLGGGPTRWGPVLTVAVLVSAGNAALHARKVEAK